MMPLICPGCGGRIDIEGERELVPFSCPYCAQALVPEKNGQATVLKAGKSPAAPVKTADAGPLLQRAKQEKDPVKRYALLLEAEKASPGNLQVQLALLLHGRLHERSKRQLDFSVIKCYLLHIFEEPKAYSPARRQEICTALFSEDRLTKAMAMAPDPQAFLKRYLTELSGEYIHLFLRGSSRYMKPMFGFSMGGKPEKLLASPAAAMLASMREEPFLDTEKREMLAQAFYEAFSREFQGQTAYLDSALNALQI